MNVKPLKLCLVTNLENQSFDDYKPLVLKAIQGGITSVQLRKKTDNLNEFAQLAYQFKELLKPFAIPLIINDHVEIAKIVNAEGVHIGQTDISPAIARKILGSDKLIGLSIETEAELEIANQLFSIDYVAVSAVFATKTKPNCKTIWGIDGLKRFNELSRHPFVAIGGIKKTNVAEVMECGACGVAVISAIHTHQPKVAAEELISTINRVIHKN